MGPMSNPLKKPKIPKPDPSIERDRREAEARAKAETDALEATEAEERRKRAAGLRGFDSLLSGGFTGFSLGGGASLQRRR